MQLAIELGRRTESAKTISKIWYKHTGSKGRQVGPTKYGLRKMYTISQWSMWKALGFLGPNMIIDPSNPPGGAPKKSDCRFRYLVSGNYIMSIIPNTVILAPFKLIWSIKIQRLRVWILNR